MIATAGLTVPHSINPIFPYIFDCLGFNPTNDNFDFESQGLNRLWVVSVTLMLNESLQKMGQRSKITAPTRPIAMRFLSDYSIFQNGAQKIDCYVCCVESGPVLFKPNVVHINHLNFWKPKFVEYGTLTFAIDRISGSMLIFQKNGPMMPPYRNPHQTVTCCKRIDLTMITFGFSEPQMWQFCLLTLLNFCRNNRKCTEKLGWSNEVL